MGEMEAQATRLDALVALAAAARGGARDALETLLARSAGLAHAVARARLGDGLAAEEAAVDALARVARGIERLGDPRAYPRWLCRIAARCAANSVWRRRTEPPRDREDPAPAPLERLVTLEGRRAVREAVDALPRRLREVVYLHFLEDLSYREVARALGRGVATVARRMERAFALLRVALGGGA